MSQLTRTVNTMKDLLTELPTKQIGKKATQAARGSGFLRSPKCYKGSVSKLRAKINTFVCVSQRNPGAKRLHMDAL